MPRTVAPKAETAFRTAKPAAKAYRIGDGGGLYLQVMPGGMKKWRFQYTRPTGGRNTLSLGSYPIVTAAAAREARDTALRQLSQRIDPGERRKADKAERTGKAGNSFEAVAREWHAKKKSAWSMSYAERVLTRLEQNVFPWIGKRPISEITAPELLGVLRRIEERGAIETTHRVKQDAGQIFRFAIASGKAERDIAADLRDALQPVQAQHVAALTEPRDIAPLLRAIDSYPGSLVVRTALRLAPLVFVRPGELRHARWQDIDFDKQEWRYNITKTRRTGVAEHIVPLSAQAVTLLKELQPLTGDKEFVFPSNRSRGRPISENTINKALSYLGYDGNVMRGHGFRATARTVLDEVLQVPPHIIEQQLAHMVRDPLGRAYNRTAHLSQRRDMMQRWADYLDELKSGGEAVVNQDKEEA